MVSTTHNRPMHPHDSSWNRNKNPPFPLPPTASHRALSTARVRNIHHLHDAQYRPVEDKISYGQLRQYITSAACDKITVHQIPDQLAHSPCSCDGRPPRQSDTSRFSHLRLTSFGGGERGIALPTLVSRSGRVGRLSGGGQKYMPTMIAAMHPHCSSMIRSRRHERRKNRR